MSVAYLTGDVNGIKLVSGIMTTGTFTGAGWTSVGVTFPITFSNVPEVGFVGELGTGGFVFGHQRILKDSCTTTGFSIQFEIETAPSPAGNMKWYWWAVGR